MLLCNRRTHLITQRSKRQGLTQKQLQNVFDAIIVFRLLDAAPAWRGYLSSAEIDCLQGVLDKAKRWKLICREYSVVDLLDKCDRTLLKSSLCLSHSVNHLFPDKRHHTHLMSISHVDMVSRYLSVNIYSRIAHLLTVNYLRFYDFHYFNGLLCV